jgi:hypothetical protein
MMWIVRIALGQPYTFVLKAVLIEVLGGLSISTMETDISRNPACSEASQA